MTRQFVGRLALAGALILPVVASAMPDRQAQAAAPSQVWSKLSISVDSSGTRPAKLTLTSPDGSQFSAEAQVLRMTYAGADLTVDMTAGSLTTTPAGQASFANRFETLQFQFANGNMVGMKLLNP